MKERKKPHFDISAAVVRQLGEELVSDEITALIELVKNAYDADASFASVIVDTSQELNSDESFFAGTKGCIIIEDDGTGMSRSDIERGWLTISLSNKRGMKRGRLVTAKGRTPLGDKGLGRLSTQRLGNQLDLFTIKEEANETYHVAFSWSDFTEDVPLSVVPVSLQEANVARRKGTKLVISDLQNPDVWWGDRRTELVRKLSQLIFPFGEVRPFRVFITINGQRIDLETVAESVRDAAVARFAFNYTNGKLLVDGKIRLARLKALGAEKEESYQQFLAQDRGKEFFAFLTSPSNRFSIPNANYNDTGNWFIDFAESRELASLGGVASIAADSDELSLDIFRPTIPSGSKAQIADPGNFTAEIDEFALRGVDVDALDIVFDRNADFSDFVKKQSGVRIFRNGFGIRPYGMDGNDWLNLGGGQTSGLSYYGLRPKNIIGYVALTEEENRQLREKTDREGLIDSPYANNFFLLANEAVRIINHAYNNLRRSYNEFRRARSDAQNSFRSTSSVLTEMRATSSTATRLEQQSDQVQQRLSEVTQSVKAATDRVEKEPLFASSVDRQLAPLLKEVNTALLQAKDLVVELQKLLPKAKSLAESANYLEPRIAALEAQIEMFSELAGLGLTAEALSHEMQTVAERLAAETRSVINSLKKKNIQSLEVTVYTEYVLSAVSTLRKQLAHLAPSLQYMREQRDIIPMKAFFEDLRDFYAERFLKPGITFDIKEPFDNFIVRMNKGKLTQVVDNLVLNSEYWLKEAIRNQGIQNPMISVSSISPYFYIEDNGLGVDPSIEASLFQPFVTTKPRNQGRGLGLFIVQQLLDSTGGDISLLPQRNKNGRRYVFQVNLSGVIHGS